MDKPKNMKGKHMAMKGNPMPMMDKPTNSTPKAMVTMPKPTPAKQKPTNHTATRPSPTRHNLTIPPTCLQFNTP